MAAKTGIPEELVREEDRADASMDGCRERKRVLPVESGGAVRAVIIPCATF